ncbi:hypothetical protein [Lederbergia graminis]
MLKMKMDWSRAWLSRRFYADDEVRIVERTFITTDSSGCWSENG